VLSQLSVETTQAVRQEWEKLQKRYAEYRQTQEKTGKPVEPLVVAQMHREYREQLERLLTSEQLEEFLLRNSQVSQRLRQDLAGFNTTSEEFRAIFKARDAAERQLMWATVTSLESYAQQRQQLNQQAEKEIERALGPERYREYKFNSDPVYREARSFAEDFGAAPEAVVPLYEIRRTTAAEEQQIRNDSTMTPEERIAALQAVRQYSEEAIRQLIGDEAYARYEKSLGKPKK